MEPPKKRGRPHKPADQKLERRAMFLTPAQWAKVDAYGLEWLRKLIEKARPPK